MSEFDALLADLSRLPPPPTESEGAPTAAAAQPTKPLRKAAPAAPRRPVQMGAVLEQLAGLQRQAEQGSQRAAQDSRLNFERANMLLKSLTAEGRLTSLWRWPPSRRASTTSRRCTA